MNSTRDANSYSLIQTERYMVAVFLIPATPSQSIIQEFTDPTRVHRWWGAELYTDGQIGGPYRVNFPQAQATLDGKIIEHSETRFSFTWDWEGTTHKGKEAAYPVISTQTVHDAAMVTITHGPYDSPISDPERQSHEDGWRFYIPRLIDDLTKQNGEQRASRL